MRRPKPETWVLIGLAVGAFVWAWLASSVHLAMRLNWDTANYVAVFASGEGGWSRAPWNSHYAMGPIYWIGHLLAAPFGGAFVDGARLVNALALALAALFVAQAARRLSGFLLGAAACTLLYLFSWGVAILLLSLEDNVLYLPWITATLCLCVMRLGQWRARDSLIGGALCGLGGLVSWQAGLYLFPVLFVALLLGGDERKPALRARDAGLVVVGFAATIFSWVLFYAATARDQSLRGLVRVLFSRPEPSFFPETWGDVRLLLLGPQRIFRHLGTGLLQEAGPFIEGARALRIHLPDLGLLFFVVLGAGTLFAAVRAQRKRDWNLAFILVVFLALTVATSFYVDLPSDKYKRYEYVPLFSCLVVAALLGAPYVRGWRPEVRHALVAILIVLALGELGLSIAAARDHRARLPTFEPPGYQGPGHEPWFVYFRNLRAATPDRCRYVFTLDELSHGRYQMEIPASLWDALPDHLLLGDAEDVAHWRVKPRVASWQSAGSPRACDFRSADVTAGPSAK